MVFFPDGTGKIKRVGEISKRKVGNLSFIKLLLTFSNVKERSDDVTFLLIIHD